MRMRTSSKLATGASSILSSFLDSAFFFGEKLFASFLFLILTFFRWKFSIVKSNVKFLSPHSTEKQIRRFYKKLIAELSRTASAFLFGNRKFSTPNKNFPLLLEKESVQIFEKMKRGGVFLAAHFGNYEAIGKWMLSLEIPLCASYQKFSAAKLNRILESRLRRGKLQNEKQFRPYSKFFNHPKEILQTLDEKNLFCLVADQDYRKRSAVPSEFFGQKVLCNPIPKFILSHRRQTPFFICWIEESKNSAVLCAREIQTETTLNETSIYRAYHDTLENLIKKSPEKWFGWTHRRFLGAHSDLTIYQHY